MQCTQYSCCQGNRSFMTRTEKIEMLKEYQESLNKELQGVKEKIQELAEE